MILKTSRPYLYFLNSIKWKLLAIIAVVIAVGEADDVLYKIFDFDLAIPAFLGTTIVLALAFRTNQAYQRWWEAKEIWEGIVNCSRTWFRMALKFLKPTPEEQLKGESLERVLVQRQIAWNYILSRKLRETPPLEDMDRLLSADDLSFLSTIDNPTQGLLMLQGRDLKKAFDQGRIPIYQHIEMEETLRLLEAYMGKAERIKKTHFPVLYDLLIEFSIYVFAALLTYAIRDANTFFEALFSIIVSFIFLSLDEIARDMQDPFENRPTDTPMSTISYQVEREGLQLLGIEEMPAPPAQGAFYIS